MDPRVGSTCSMGHHLTIGEPTQHPLKFTLDRPARSLPLPAGELAAVEFQLEQEVPVHQGGI